ncbi:MAG: DUF4832 domain-containing protein [Lachnospiraceae bacterium]|nr:DUF4832 domain-containing protein [Lachnospiraceae bacterium]
MVIKDIIKHLKKAVACFAMLALMLSMWQPVSLPVYADEGGEGFEMDGNGEDWLYITPIFSAGGIITKLSAFTLNGTLYGKMELSTSANFDTWHIYFDTDGDTANHLYFNGADYLLETDILYVYKGDSGEWDGLEGMSAIVQRGLSSDKKTLEFSFSLEDIGNPEKIGIHAATVSNWVDVADCPAIVGEYLNVPAYEEVHTEEITGLTPQELEAYIAAKEFSGSKNQWGSILYDAVNQNSNLLALKAVTDRENLYIHADTKVLSNNFSVYIETDSATYELKANGSLFRTQDGKRIDTGTPIKNYYKADSGFEIVIPTSVLEGGTDLYRVRMKEGREVLPDEDPDDPDTPVFLEVTASIDEEPPKITIDGDAGDWAGIEPIGHGEGSLGDLYAFRDNDNLYVMTYIKGVTDPESSAAYTTSLFIGSDNDDSTGFIHSGYAHHNTGDMLFQDWLSYGEDRNLEFFYTKEPVILEWNMKKQYVEGFDKVFAPTGEAGTYCAEYIVPIEMMHEFTDEVGDDLYICIDRNDVQTDEVTYERMTPEGFTPARDPENGSFAKVPKYRITFDMTAEDFDFSDWNTICNTAKHQNNVNLLGIKSEEKIYTMLTGNGDLSTVNRYYISTGDGGYKYDGRENVYYVIDSGKLYEVTADNTLAGEGKSIYQYYESDAVLMQLYLSDIGSPNTVRIAADANNGEYVLPAEGYLTISRTIEENREAGLYYPKAAYDFHNNPYKGWVGWADINEGDVDTILSEHNLIYVDIKWSELEPEKGTFAFDALEEQYQFEKWKKAGCRMVFRFVMDNPNLINHDPNIKRMDIPQWLYDELAEENAEGGGAGTFYNGETILGMLGGVGFSPNYKSAKLLAYHEAAIKAFAERYDDPAITAYVEVGSLGHWAEFHTWPTGTGEFPDPELAQKYMQVYADAFHNVRVGIRKPYALAAENNWGLYNDIFGVTSDGGTPTFLEWAASGNTDMPGSTPEDIAASAMPDWWKLNYSGGEFANGDFRTNALNENICAVLDQIRDSHTTWLGPCSACDFKVGDPQYESFRYNIETMFSTMGYNYGIYSLTQPERLITGENNVLSITWNNTGVAPIYYNCPVTLSLKDAGGNVVYEQVQDFDTTKWLPGRSTVEASLNVPSDIAEGEYTLSVKMTTADSRKDIIYLTMEGGQADGSYDLYKVAVGGKLEEKNEGAAKGEDNKTADTTQTEAEKTNSNENVNNTETSSNTETTTSNEAKTNNNETGAKAVTEKSGNNTVLWIVLGIAAAALIGAGVVVVLKKRG